MTRRPPISGLEPSSSRRGLTALAALVALAPFAVLLWRFSFVCDDAYIAFRYARNLAEGLGLVYNPGVEPPVEGYSELLWVLVVAAGMRLGLAPEPVSLVLSGLAGAAVLILTAHLLATRAARTPAATLGAALVLGTLPPMAVWSSSGLATMPFALAVLVLFERLYGSDQGPRPIGAALAATAAVLLRADGAFWVAALAGPPLLAWSRRSERARAALAAALIGAIVFGAHVTWRSLTYEDWLPNTARAKLGLSSAAFERGGLYLGLFALTFPALAVGLALPLLAPWRLAGRLVPPALALIIATALYVVLVGGDFMAFGRFLVPALPFAVLVVGAGLGAFEAGRASLARRAGTLLLALMIAVLDLLPAFDRHVVPQSVREPLNFRHNLTELTGFRSEFGQWARMRAQAREWTDLGRALAHYASPQDSVVYPAVGAVGYFSRLFVYDCNGLVTREVALRPPLGKRTSPGHDKTVPKEFFLKDQPTWLDVFFQPKGWPRPPAPFVVHELEGPLVSRLETRIPGDLFVLLPGPE